VASLPGEGLMVRHLLLFVHYKVSTHDVRTQGELGIWHERLG
jgi:hypothetical protein